MLSQLWRRLTFLAHRLRAGKLQWTFAWLESLLQDTRYGLRTFRRAPLFSCGIATTTGLGIGLICSLFTIFNAYVLRPFAVHDPHSLYEFQWITNEGRRHGFSWPELEYLRSDAGAFSEVIASSSTIAFIDGRSSPGRLVTGNYFSALGVQATIGRVLLPEDAATPGARPVVVLSHNAWKNKFAGDPDVLGRKIVIRGYPFEIVGVTRAEFNGLEDSTFKDYGPDFWAPITMSRQFYNFDLFGSAGRNELSVIGRVRPQTSEQQASAMLESYARSVTAGLPEGQRPVRFSLNPRATVVPLTPGLLAAFSVILTIFGLVLLIACANVANMMLARATARQREIGVRLSLGAGRPRLVRQLVTEALLLSLPGAAIGFAIASAVASFGPRFIRSALLTPEFAAMVRLPSLDPDTRVFLFAFLAAMMSAILFSLAPAMQATRASLTNVSKGGFGNDPRPGRLRNALVTLQVTLCVVFLISAGVLLRGSRQLAQRNTGMDLTNVVVATGSATTGTSLDLADGYRRQIAERLSTDPWVEQIATVWRAPLGGGLRRVAVLPSSATEQVRAVYNFVSPEYFQVLGIPIKRGRSFTRQESDSESAVVIVSEATALRFWPNQDPIGQSLIVGRVAHPSFKAPVTGSAQVIGVTGDVISGSIPGGIDSTSLYFPFGRQRAQHQFLIRVRGSVQAARRPLAATLESAAPQSTWQFVPMEEWALATLLPFRAASLLAWILGSVALVLTVSGIYGVMSYAVSQRTREIGIRMALGATRAGVTRTILGQSLKLVGFGGGVGVLMALALSRLLAANNETINTFDSLAYLAGIATVVLAALAAAYFPSRRAACLDPAETLRSE